MTAHVEQEQTTLQTLDRNVTLHRPIRDVSLADFSWVAQKSIYANPILVMRHRPGVEEQHATYASSASLRID